MLRKPIDVCSSLSSPSSLRCCYALSILPFCPTLYWKYMSDNYALTRDVFLFEYHPSLASASAESINGTKHRSVGTHATVYHIADIPHNPHLHANNTETSKPCGSMVQAAALTRQALQQHNTKNKLPDCDVTAQYSHPQDHTYGTTLKHTITYISTSSAYNLAPIEPYFYPRQHHQLQLSTTFLQEHKKDTSVGIGRSRSPYQPIECQCLYPYPTFIYQADLEHISAQSKSHGEPLPAKQELLQGAATWGNVLAGVGAQFSG